MSAKKPSVAKDPAAKRLTRKQAKERAELAAREALKTNFVAPFPEVTPLELAHLVAAMGLGEQEDGPSKALSLLSRSAAYIEGMKAQFERLNAVIAPGKVDEIRIMAELGLSIEDAKKTFTVDEVIRKMPKDPLNIAGESLRGRRLWDEFLRQVNPKLGHPGKTDEGGSSPEEYTLGDLLRIYQEFKEWRSMIAAANMTKTSKNIDEVNQERENERLRNGAEAVDAAPLP